jgi:urease accessory protein
MIRATKVDAAEPTDPSPRRTTAASGRLPERESEAAGKEDSVLLDFDARYRRRTAMRSEGGLDFLLDLERAQRLRHGDLLVLEDGRRIRVEAAPEDLAQIACTAPGGLTRIAWHLGNRHLPVMVALEYIRIRRDHVIEEMVLGLGGTVTPVRAAFDPERGAYAGGHAHANGSDDGG